MFQQVIIAGRLGRDQEGRYTPNGKFVSNFSVAVDDGYGESKKTLWIKVSFFGDRAEKVAQYLTKGQVVLITGRLQSTDQGECRTWQDQGGKTHASFEMVADNIKLLPGGPKHDEIDVSTHEQPAALPADIPF